MFVAGLPETKGSWKAVGRGAMKRDNPREKAWATKVGWAVRLELRGQQPVADRVRIELDFYLPEPKGRKNQRDIDKLCRSALDAMNGLVYVDDEQVVELAATKIVVAEAMVGMYVGVRIAPAARTPINQRVPSDLRSALPPGAIEWLCTGERGESSEAIFAHLTGIPICGSRRGYPSDPDDMRRCRLLLDAVPEFYERFDEMKTCSKQWAALVRRWGEVCRAIDDKANLPGTGYRLMKEIDKGVRGS